MTNPTLERPTSLGGCATLACLWEATASKPGNVHRGADFEDMTFVDFLASAAVIGPVIDRCHGLGLGGTVLEAVQATRQTVATNTNLGTLLLIAPLALSSGDLSAASEIICDASQDDTRQIYQAIRTALPGGMGKVDEGDVSAEPVHSLLEAMQLAAERDLVARQYTNGFAEVADAVEHLQHHFEYNVPLNDAIVLTQLYLLSRHGDSLIARKLGVEASQDIANRASSVLAAYQQHREDYFRAVADFDFWLRADGHRRNPGTTADLLAAALFVLLVRDRLDWPVTFYGSPPSE